MQLTFLLTLAIYFLLLYGAVFWLLLYLENKDKIYTDPKLKKFRAVTIVIPAYNAAGTIRDVINSCLGLHYPKDKIKIIVVDDGSTDKTGDICREFVWAGRIKYVKQKNLGKAMALNNGLKFVDTELVCCLDADTTFDKDAFKYMFGYFEDEKVAAVLPSIRIKKIRNTFERLQWMEYLLSMYLRRLMTFINALYIVPGAGSVYRTKLLKGLHGFDPSTPTEDMDVAFRLQEKGHVLQNTVNAKVYTMVPDNFNDLFKQRLRWCVGYLENIKKYRRFVLNKDLNDLGLFLIPYDLLWIFSIFVLFLIFLRNYHTAIRYTISNIFLLKSDVISYYLSDLHMPTFEELFYQITIIDIFFVFFLALGLLTFYLVIKLSKESHSLKTITSRYVLYSLIYFPLLASFWLISFIYELLNKGEKKWKGRDLKLSDT